MTTADGDKYANSAAKWACFLWGGIGDSFLVFVFDTLISISLAYLLGQLKSANCNTNPPLAGLGRQR